MKVIFLDIDGVLNSDKSIDDGYKKSGIHMRNHLPHKMHIDPLNEIIKKTGAVCVISSTWRKHYNKDHLGVMNFSMLLWACGYEGKVIDFTPNLNKRRGFEIQAWLDECKEDIESFVILDDNSDMEHLMDYLYLLDDRIGLEMSDVDKIVERLNGERNEDNR